MRRRLLGFGGCALLLAGCTAVSRPTPSAGASPWRPLASAATRRYPLALGEVASGATPIRRVPPVYPPSLLAACPPPAEVAALLIVDARGTVVDVRESGGAAVDPAHRLLQAAVRAAAVQWIFNPLQVAHWAADADGNSHVVDSQARPFSLEYVFRFECHRGQPTVAAEKTGAPAG